MSFINRVSEFLDNHIRILTNIGYIFVGIGVLSIARRSRLLTKFTHPADIPNDFVSRGIKLRGVVKGVSLDNTIQVDHVPSFRHPKWLRKTFIKDQNFLKLGLAGIRLHNNGCVALKNELVGETVWFKLLSGERPMPTNPPAVAYRRKALILRNVNVYAVRMGYAVAEQLPACDQPGVQKHLQKDLFKAQKYAAKKKLGVWKD